MLHYMIVKLQGSKLIDLNAQDADGTGASASGPAACCLAYAYAATFCPKRLALQKRIPLPLAIIYGHTVIANHCRQTQDITNKHSRE